MKTADRRAKKRQRERERERERCREEEKDEITPRCSEIKTVCRLF